MGLTLRWQSWLESLEQWRRAHRWLPETAISGMAPDWTLPGTCSWGYLPYLSSHLLLWLVSSCRSEGIMWEQTIASNTHNEKVYSKRCCKERESMDMYAKGSRVNMVESQKSEHLGTQSVSLGLYYCVLIWGSTVIREVSVRTRGEISVCRLALLGWSERLSVFHGSLTFCWLSGVGLGWLTDLSLSSSHPPIPHITLLHIHILLHHSYTKPLCQYSSFLSLISKMYENTKI